MAVPDLPSGHTWAAGASRGIDGGRESDSAGARGVAGVRPRLGRNVHAVGAGRRSPRRRGWGDGDRDRDRCGGTPCRGGVRHRGGGEDARITRELALNALRMALTHRPRPEMLVHHSDRGSQYASADYRRLLDAHAIECSMSRRGNCWDNAAVESFFATLKTELIHHTDYHSPAQAKGRDLRVHRGVLKSATSPLDPRLPDTSRLRADGTGSLTNLSTDPGEDHLILRANRAGQARAQAGRQHRASLRSGPSDRSAARSHAAVGVLRDGTSVHLRRFLQRRFRQAARRIVELGRAKSIPKLLPHAGGARDLLGRGGRNHRDHRLRGIHAILKGYGLISVCFGGYEIRTWWSRWESNPRPQHCERCALPTELRPR